MPCTERRLGEAEILSAIDIFESAERLVVLPATHDAVRQYGWARNAALDRELDGGRHQDFGRFSCAITALAQKFLVAERDYIIVLVAPDW